MGNKLKKLLQQAVTYCLPKRIVYSQAYPPGIYLKATEVKGKRYVSIAVTNQIDGHAIVYHIPAAKVVGIKRAITPLQRWWYTQVLHKPLPVYKLKLVKP